MAAIFKILEFLRKITENLRYQTQVQAAGQCSGSGHVWQTDLPSTSPVKFRQTKTRGLPSEKQCRLQTVREDGRTDGIEQDGKKTEQLNMSFVRSLSATFEGFGTNEARWVNHVKCT